MMNGDRGSIGRALYEELFHKIMSQMSVWRIENRYGKSSIGILRFVSGLRFSALLIYAIREILSGTGLDADWGHLIDRDEHFCSRECDIIIHRNGHCRRWNGDGGDRPIMDFQFIRQRDAVAVISCKSHIKSNEVDSDYCQSIRQFVSRVWLFAECCGPRSGNSIRNRARDLGYDNFWYLYSWTRAKGIIEMNTDGWQNFASELRGLAN